jgi:hypothetical protein
MPDMTESEFMGFMDEAADYQRKHPRGWIVTRTFEYEGETIRSGFYRLAEGPCDCGFCNKKLAKAINEREI